MSLNPNGMSGRSWNFSRPNDDDYSLELWGTVVAMQEVQAREYNPNSNQPGRPRTWPDGKPVMNIRIGFASPDGSLKTITFGKAGKAAREGKKFSLHMLLFGLSGNNMTSLNGKTIHMWTWPADPETNQPWGQGNPRKFGAELVDNASYELNGELPPEFLVPELLCNDGAAGGQPVAPSPQQMYAPQVPPMQGGFYAAPAAQPMYQSQAFNQGQAMPMQQPMAPAPQQMAPTPQAAPQPMGMMAPMPAVQAMPPQTVNNPMPQGMDPAVAQAMQAVGAVNVQEIDPTGGIYDDDIPFD